MMKIEAIETAYYRLPLEPMGDAGHGAIDSEEIITVKVRAGGGRPWLRLYDRTRRPRGACAP